MRARIRAQRLHAATVASITPVNAPRQPACAAPINAGLRIGEQQRSASRRWRHPIASAGVRVTMASARGRLSCDHGTSAITTSGE